MALPARRERRRTTPPTPRPAAHGHPGARLTLDHLVRAERGDRLTAMRLYGRMGALLAAPAPVAVDVVDAQALTVATMVELAWLAANVLRSRDFGWPPIAITLPAPATS